MVADGTMATTNGVSPTKESATGSGELPSSPTGSTDIRRQRRRHRRRILLRLVGMLCVTGLFIPQIWTRRYDSVITSTTQNLFRSVLGDPSTGHGGDGDDHDLERTVCVYSSDDVSDLVQRKNRTLRLGRPPGDGSEPAAAACRVLVENRPDYHYELVESVILKYPLPWANLTDCDFSRSSRVIFDVGLSKSGWFSDELDDYKAYFRAYLRGTHRERLAEDGAAVTAVIGDLVPWGPYDREFAARIGVSCGTHSPRGYINADVGRNFCVLHTSCNERDCDDNTEPRSCWLNPMHERCHFMASVFPMFPESLCNDDGTKIRLCTVGGAKQHHLLASALGSDKAYYKNAGVVVQVQDRSNAIPRDYNNSHVEDLVTVARSKSYLAFQEAVSKCHILLPLLDPERNGGYFRFEKGAKGARKLSGSLSQVVGYALPTVMHEELYIPYKDVLKGPATTYNSTLSSFVQSLNTMIEQVRESLPGEIEKACANPNIVRGKKCIERQGRRPANAALLPVKSVARSQEKAEPNTIISKGTQQEAREQEVEETKPGQGWISSDPLLRGQEERQFQWEQTRRQQRDEGQDRIRSEFQQEVVGIANSPLNQALQAKANMLLKEALFEFARDDYNSTDNREDPVFDDIIVAVNLTQGFMELGDGRGQSKKALVGERMFQQLNGTCVLYGAGIAYETSFETKFARRFGCAVHSFDCTMLDRERLKAYINRQKNLPNLAFHPWCVGEEIDVANQSKMRGPMYDMSKLSKNASSAMVRLEEIMDRLRHKEVDVLKFDIEGFEWSLFDSILKSKHLPRQVAFELHTRHANRHYVPPNLVAEKGREAVVKLFDRLYQLGYRTVSKELNFGDFRCAEFVVYRFYDEQVLVHGDSF